MVSDDHVRLVGEEPELEVDEALGRRVALDACVQDFDRSRREPRPQPGFQLARVGIPVLVVALRRRVTEAEDAEPAFGLLQADLRTAEPGAVGDEMQTDSLVTPGVGHLLSRDARGQAVVEADGDVQVGTKHVRQVGVTRVVELPFPFQAELPGASVVR